MSKITDELRFYTQRPLPDDVALDKQDMPIIKAVSEDELDLEHLTPTNFQNIKKDFQKLKITTMMELLEN